MNPLKILLPLIMAVSLTQYINCQTDKPENGIFADKKTAINPLQKDTKSSIQDKIFESRSNAITRAVHDVSPAVVGINVKQVHKVKSRSYFNDPMWNYFFPQEYYKEIPSVGSGFIISADGYILTNQHVVDEATEIIISTTNGKQYTAEIIGQDSRYDIALLKIDISGTPFIPLGNSDDIIIAEWVIALGNPFGLFDVNAKPTVTVGVVSATNMDFRDTFEGKSYVSMIQTDAAINGGNSGGPLVNSLGECIGINTFIFSSDNSNKGSIGLGFAIPINRIKDILPDLKNVGYIDRSFNTGLRVENISYYTARIKNISTSSGVIVRSVEKNSTADVAGIKKGDIIIQIAGNRVNSTADARHYIDSFDVREHNILEIKVFRNGKIHDFKLKVN